MISLILSFQQLNAHRWHHLGSSGSLSLLLPCRNELPTNQLHGGDEANASTWPFWKEIKGGRGEGRDGDKLPPHTRTDAASVKRFGRPLRGRRFCSTTWHSVQRFKDWTDDRRCQGGLGDTPRLCCSYGDYQVIMHAFIYLFNTSLRGVHIIIIYILGLIMLATKWDTYIHTLATHLSPSDHTQTLEWQLVPCKPEISLDCSPI